MWSNQGAQSHTFPSYKVSAYAGREEHSQYLKFKTLIPYRRKFKYHHHRQHPIIIFAFKFDIGVFSMSDVLIVLTSKFQCWDFLGYGPRSPMQTELLSLKFCLGHSYSLATTGLKGGRPCCQWLCGPARLTVQRDRINRAAWVPRFWDQSWFSSNRDSVIRHVTSTRQSWYSVSLSCNVKLIERKFLLQVKS